MLRLQEQQLEVGREAKLRAWLISAEAIDFIRVVTSEIDAKTIEAAELLSDPQVVKSLAVTPKAGERITRAAVLKQFLETLAEYQRRPKDKPFKVMGPVVSSIGEELYGRRDEED